MLYKYSKDFKQYEKFTVTNIYTPYRFGGVRSGDKFIGRTFRLKDNLLEEQIWTDKRPDWKTARGKVIVYDHISQESVEIEMEDALKDPRFWKTYRKVFDVVLKVGGEDITIKSLGAFKVQKMLKADIDLDVPMDGDKEEFDWEDHVYKKLVGREFRMKVTGTGLDTEYNIQLVGKPEEKAIAADLGEGFKADDSDALPF